MASDFGSGTEGYSQIAIYIIIVFLTLAMYNVIELTFIIWGTFKRHSGLYFWSFLGASWGIPFYCAGFLVKYFAPASLGYLAATLIAGGWIAMVTGQSLVLWSRLHLVLRNRFRLKIILWMIIIDAVACHGAIIPMIYGSFSDNPKPWVKPYSIMEKIQVTIFFIQEIIISSFYIIETVKLMKLEKTMGNGKASRRLMNHLIVVNFVIILLDITILGLEYADQYQYQTSYKAFVYSTKLKLEFTILNRLVEMTTGNKDNSSGPRSRTQPTNIRTGIALDTYASDAGGKGVGDVSYQAYAMGGEEGSASDQPRGTSIHRDDGVMMTTEIVVHREMRQDDDGMSIGRKSSANSTIGQAKTFDGGNLSKSSSELHLASRGY
ncbi:hypothetical protein EDB81DRAFT_90621 [Dactylonectria macrodidyma]|uniref:DUF7703 domain-containing protein n=1 Tax=Dactylonectria macrodidyma TaxID=307937 RepID=A0A9P9EBH3_9HYPO|nr:hypothetical protein EDB81DRAFT_90621 [Dactylonectria macrodidyma]